MSADYRALCAEPTDEQLMELMPQQMRDDLAAAARALAGFDRANIKAAGAMRIILNRHAVDHARAVLARWGNPTTQPPAAGEVAELMEWLRESLDCALQSGNSKSIKNHCRLLDLLGRPTLQPVPEPVALTDEEIEEWADACSEAPLEEMDPEVHGWRRCFTAKEFSETIRAALDRWGHSTPQPVWADIHYAWELEDAEGEWQAGGSANSLEDVQREGNRYLQTYSQDGPHKLIIQRHCVSTIEEVTND